MALRALLALLVALAPVPFVACDRAIEPFVPEEEPAEPDLSKIFPAGAERSAQAVPQLPEPPTPAGGRGAPPLAGTADPIRGTVTLARGLEDRVPDGAVLFLIARPGASGPPLAVKRIPSPYFPLEFAIGPEDRMIRTLPFAGSLRLSARLDGDGNATTRSPGDLQGAAPGSYLPGASDVSLVIDEIL